MTIKERIKASLRLGIPLAFGVLVLWLIYRGIDMAEVNRVLRAEVDFGILGFSLLFGLGANLIRGLRWHLLVQPIVPAGEPMPKLSNAIYTVLGSYTVNMGIPRAGELWRCAEYKRYEGITFSSLFGTLINDRLADVISLGIILACTIVLYSDFFLGFFHDTPSISSGVHSIGSSVWLYVAIALGLLLLGIGIWAVRRYPESKAAKIVYSIMHGISSIRYMPQRGLFITYSVLIWIGYFGYFYTTFYAFPFTQGLPIEAGIIAFAMSSMSALAPVQAGLGPWHFMVITTLTAYGVTRADAGAFALIVHTTQTLWITLVGLVAIIALPIVNRRYSRLNANQHNS